MRAAGMLLLLAIVGEAWRLAVPARIPIHPDFLLGIVVLGALTYRSPSGAVIGFGVGLIRDIVYGSAVGFAALPFTVVGWLVGSLGRSVYRESIVTQGVVIFLAGMAKGGFDYMLLRGGELDGILVYLLRICLLSSLESAIVIPIFYRAAKELSEVDYRRLIRDGLRAYERKLFVKRH
jgi:rod shape-determining protein MreD